MLRVGRKGHQENILRVVPIPPPFKIVFFRPLGLTSMNANLHIQADTNMGTATKHNSSDHNVDGGDLMMMLMLTIGPEGCKETFLRGVTP